MPKVLPILEKLLGRVALFAGIFSGLLAGSFLVVKVSGSEAEVGNWKEGAAAWPASPEHNLGLAHILALDRAESIQHLQCVVATAQSPD